MLPLWPRASPGPRGAGVAHWLLVACALVAPLRSRAGEVPAALRARALREGSVRVIAELDVAAQPEGRLRSASEVSEQRDRIRRSQDSILSALQGSGHRLRRRFGSIPFVALEVPAAALDRLRASAQVLRVVEDRAYPPTLAQSTPLVEATQAVASGLTGAGQSVAIIDTGVDSSHPFLSPRVVREACFSAGRDCPNRRSSQTGSGAAAPCAWAPNTCRHGTHVAGIAAGDGDSFDGVAPAASILAIQVFSEFTGSSCVNAGEDPCALSFVSDQIAALEYVLSLHDTLSIAAVNMSLGSGSFSEPCDASEAATKAAIDNLRSVGIATVVASGNEGLTAALAAPACISTAISVGSSTKSDLVSSFSNSAAFLSLLAPGSSIRSSVPGGTFAFMSGTSMAAPHVTGALALLRTGFPGASVTSLTQALQDTGAPITDARNGLTKPRIRILAAASQFGCVGPDSDADGTPDACDACPADPLNDADGDGLCADVDVCPQDPLNDADGDGVCADVDLCPGFPDSQNSDQDALPDGCDACPLDPLNDADGDGACGDVDLCPGFPDGQDADADSLPDGCDACPLDPLNDADGDGACGDVDLCPGFDDRLDADQDGIPDGCDAPPRLPAAGDGVRSAVALALLGAGAWRLRARRRSGGRSRLLALAFLIGTARAANAGDPLAGLSGEDRAALEALALYPEDVRTRASEVAVETRKLMELDDLRARSEQAFRELLDPLSREDREQLYELSRHPALVRELALGAKSEAERERVARLAPEEIRPAVRQQGREHPRTLARMHSLSQDSERRFSQLISDLPPAKQKAFRALLATPELIALLTEHMQMTRLLGSASQRDPEDLRRRLRDLNLEAARKNAEDAAAWERELDRDPDLRRDYQQAGREFERETGFSFETPAATWHVEVDPYPLWFGRPWWAPVGPGFRPWWPAPVFVSWYFHRDSHDTPHLTGYFTTRYERPLIFRHDRDWLARGPWAAPRPPRAPEPPPAPEAPWPPRAR